MCGIIGFNWKDEKLANKLGKSLKHRGPDQEGLYSDNNVTFKHQRLSIIDLSKKGQQPMWDSEKKYSIVYNGEIFNFKEIRKELEKKYEFNSETDTEVILYGYIEWGVKVLDKLNGQFAFCIYDKNKKELFLARDRIGILPLYYYDKDDKFVFGSELKIILQSGIKKEIDTFSRNYYFMYGHTPRKKTILKNAYKLEPGHYMKYDLGKKGISEYKKYWDIELTDEIENEEEAVKLMREKLEESVKKRMIADVPVGAFLSGGLDSSAIVALMSKYTDELNTFSVKFDHQEFDESEYAEMVSEKFGTNHHVVEFTAKDLRNLVPELIYNYDEPFGDPSMIPMYLVSKVASEQVTVSLSGDGGDELFGGYNSYKHYKMLQIQKFYPKFVNKIIYELLDFFNFEFLRKPKAFFEIGMLERKHKFSRLMSYLNKEEFEKLTGENPTPYYEEYAKEFKKSHFLNEAINIDLHNYIAEDILTKVDRASLAHSLESRPPILDHELIELSAKIDPRLKLKNGEGKYIFKEAMGKLLPEEVIYRKKKGFGVPLKHYFRNDLKELVEDYLVETGEKHANKNYVTHLLKQLSKEKWEKDYSKQIWVLMMFSLWYDEWVNK